MKYKLLEYLFLATTRTWWNSIL